MGVRSSDEAGRSARVDLVKIEATTEAEIEAYMIAEGENPDAPFEGYHVVAEAEIHAPRGGPKQSGDASITAAKRRA